MVDHGAHVSTEGLVHAVSLDAVPCRVRGPVSCHLPCILLITRARSKSSGRKDGNEKK